MDTKTLNSPLHLEFDPSSGVATLILNKPEVRNAFDDVLILQLTEQLKILEHDNNVRLLILRGAGNHFSAGADLHWMRRIAKQSIAENQEDALALAHLMHRLYVFPKPTLAVIQGSVFGGAVGLVACCDMAIASLDALFCLPETKLGLLPAIIAPYIIRALGERAAKRYMLTAETFDASTAYQLGLIHEAVALSELESRLQHFTHLILQNGPEALLRTKHLIYTLTHPDPEHPLSEIYYTARLIADIRATDEAQTRLSDFFNKRDRG